MSRSVDYRSHGVPLEAFELTRRDHQDQKMAEGIRVDVEKRPRSGGPKSPLTLSCVRQEAKAFRVHGTSSMQVRRPTISWMRWRVGLYCGHIVETRRHCEVDQPKAHGSSSMRCPECGMDPAQIVAYEPLGSLGKPPTVATTPQPKPPTRKALEERVAQLEDGLA
jgi:hypothetical protein